METDDPFESPEQLMERFRNSPSGKGVVARAEVAKLAKDNPNQALAIAREIEHPWYRCQAITSVAEAHQSDGVAIGLLQEAMKAAYSQSEPNRVASVSLWPLRLLVSLDSGAAIAHTRTLLQVIAQEAHGLRKLDGLKAILVAVASSPELRSLTLAPFLKAAKASQGWRTERIIDVVVQVLAPLDRRSAIELLDSRPDSRYTKRSRALLSQQSDVGDADA